MVRVLLSEILGGDFMQSGDLDILKTIADVQNITVDGIGIAKAVQRGPIGILAVLEDVAKVVGDMKSLPADAVAALPEFKAIDAAAAQDVAAASYACVKAILAAMAAA